MKIVSLDLELNQPSGKIIEIGAVCGDILTGEIVSTFETQVKIDEELAERITTLTGITPDMLSGAPYLPEAGKSFIDWATKHREFHNLMTWGGGDSEELKEQLGSSIDKWPFGFRHLDVKTVYTAYQHSAGIMHPKSGLAKSMTKMGLQFKGKKHRALCDAYNTFVLYVNILRGIKGQGIAQSSDVPKEILTKRGLCR